MKKFQPILLSLLSGLLFFIAWPTINLNIAIFFAFVPLLIIEQKKYTGLKFFGFMYLATFTWNLSTTWWVWNATMIGAWLAIILNSLLMCIPLMGYRFMNKRFGELIGYSSLIAFWMSFEYLHLQDWGLSWPWLTIGNSFAGHTNLIQWYEYTGTSGGTLWVLIINVLLFKLLQVIQTKNQVRYTLLSIISIILVLPILLSVFLLKNRNSNNTTSPTNKQRQVTAVIVQPNIDPYEKLFTGSFDAQLQQLIRLSKEKIDSNTTLLIWPETALYTGNGFDEASLKENYFLQPLFTFLKQHPNLQLFSGIESFRMFNERISNDARALEGSSNFYEVYNAGVLMDSSGSLQVYHKSMLVPGVETLPGFLNFLGPVFEKFGGTAGGYAKQLERTPIKLKNNISLAPAVCYESIYGEYMSKFVRKGANIIAIITNDGWWGNTPGYKQHLLYAKLRAIETRTWVMRSANTGVSCFISPTGEIHQPQNWWTPSATKMNINVSVNNTFFVRMGDLLSKGALLLSVLLLLYALYQNFTTRVKN